MRLKHQSMSRPNCLYAIILTLAGLAGTSSVQSYEAKAGAGAVVELFTSQGCPRCPEADALLAELGKRDGLVTLAYHIDYWDYVGWEDTFALPANTELQKAYAASWSKNRVYTPQMVINGANGIVGSQADEVEMALEASALPLELDLTIKDGDAAHLLAPAVSELLPSIVWLVTWREMAEVPIERGENSGKVLSYTHIVTGRQAIGMWSPEAGADILIPLEAALGPNDGAAILIQEKKGELPGHILGAALIER